MLNKSIRILNFDDSIVKQQNLISQYKAEIIDLKDLGPAVRFWMNKKTKKEIEERIRGSTKNSITFLGSGDFHHISEILISRINEPSCLIVFDFHPDWGILPPRFACGSWVKQAMENKNISKCILIGVGSDDLSWPALQTANLSSLADSRLEIYPYRHESSRIYFRRLPINCSITARRGFFSNEITWCQLEKEDLVDFTLKLIKRLPTRKVYISIDKDCLKKDYALTNWEEGFLHLDQLLIMLRLIRQNLDIIGLDVVGDYSALEISNKIKAFISKVDHPKEFTAHNCPVDLIRSVNEQTNLAILQEIFS